MTLLNCTAAEYRKKLNTRKIIAIAVFAVTLILNVLLCVFRNDQTHTAFLIVNILSDIACGCFLIAWYCFAVCNQSKLLKLVSATESLIQKAEGVVTVISETTAVVEGLQCLTVTIEGEQKRVVFVVLDGGVAFEKDKAYRLKTVDNIVIFAEETV